MSRFEEELKMHDKCENVYILDNYLHSFQWSNTSNSMAVMKKVVPKQGCPDWAERFDGWMKFEAEEGQINRLKHNNNSNTFTPTMHLIWFIIIIWWITGGMRLVPASGPPRPGHQAALCSGARTHSSHSGAQSPTRSHVITAWPNQNSGLCQMMTPTGAYRRGFTFLL